MFYLTREYLYRKIFILIILQLLLLKMKNKISLIVTFSLFLLFIMPNVLSHEMLENENQKIAERDIIIRIFSSFKTLPRTQGMSYKIFNIGLLKNDSANVTITLRLWRARTKTDIFSTSGYSCNIKAGSSQEMGFNIHGRLSNCPMISRIKVTVSVLGFGDDAGIEKEKTVGGFMINTQKHTLFYFYRH